VAKLASSCNSSLWLGYWITHCLMRAFTQATAMHTVNSDCWLHWKVLARSRTIIVCDVRAVCTTNSLECPCLA
jgi:hypothetical protein